MGLRRGDSLRGFRVRGRQGETRLRQRWGRQRRLALRFRRRGPDRNAHDDRGAVGAHRGSEGDHRRADGNRRQSDRSDAAHRHRRRRGHGDGREHARGLEQQSARRLGERRQLSPSPPPGATRSPRPAARTATRRRSSPPTPVTIVADGFPGTGKANLDGAPGGAAATLAYPLDHTLFPANLTPIYAHVGGATGATIARVQFEADGLALTYYGKCETGMPGTGCYVQLPQSATRLLIAHQRQPGHQDDRAGQQGDRRAAGDPVGGGGLGPGAALGRPLLLVGHPQPAQGRRRKGRRRRRAATSCSIPSRRTAPRSSATTSA